MAVHVRRHPGVLWIGVVLVVVLLLSSCAVSTRQTGPTSEPTPSWEMTSTSPYATGKITDISYGTSPAQKMDICYPPTPTQNKGAFLLIHGGSWSSGDKGDFGSLCGVIARLGYVAVTMNYRMFDQKATYADMLADIDLALATYVDTARQDGWPISKVALMGVSAGGYLSLMYSYTRQPALPIGFVAGLSTPTDFTDPELVKSADVTKYGQLSSLLGVDLSKETIEQRQAALKSASPAYRVHADAPPTILAHGAKDTVVPYSNAVIMAAQLANAGVNHDLLTYPTSNHNLADDPEVSSRFLSLVLSYATRYLG